VSLVRAKAELDRLYAELPRLDCQQKCDSACGPIAMSFVEWERIKKKVGYEPRPTSIDCPLLRSGLCSVYPIRPMICRLWGIIETMPCPWGCVPERVLSTREGYVFLAKANLIGAIDDDARAAYAEMLERLEAAEDRDRLLVLAEALHVRPRVE
jgi:Fe-S-cluster containining protein